MDLPIQTSREASSRREALVHEILARVADRWTMLVIDALEGEEEMRFSQLRARIEGISQRMLTKTLRQLERDGLVTRHVHAVVPPRVDYQLTALGMSLGEALCGIWVWAGEHMGEVDCARRAYDDANGRPSLQPKLNFCKPSA